MCLIAYVPAGRELPDAHIRSAYAQNDDGIGIMSAYGVYKFLGKKALKKARRHVRMLHSLQAEYAMHFRWATHGDVNRANCHPHALPNGKGWLMHNGVLSYYSNKATKELSDTALLAADLDDFETPFADGTVQSRSAYWDEIGQLIGQHNKLVVMHDDYTFAIVNEDAGDWIDGIWYSQTYSLPYASRPSYDRYVSKYSGTEYVWDEKAKEYVVANDTNSTNVAVSGGYGVPAVYGSDVAIGKTVAAALERRYPRGEVVPFMPKGSEDWTDDEIASYRRGWYKASRNPLADEAALDKALSEHLACDDDEMSTPQRDDYADCLLRESSYYRERG